MNTQETLINSKAKFLHCKNGKAYYALNVPYSEKLYSFPVPLDAVQDGVIASECSAIHFMDHIHKAIHDGTLIKEVA